MAMPQSRFGFTSVKNEWQTTAMDDVGLGFRRGESSFFSGKGALSASGRSKFAYNETMSFTPDGIEAHLCSPHH